MTPAVENGFSAGNLLTAVSGIAIIKTVNETFVSVTRKEAGTMRYKNAELFPMIENFINQYREKYDT